MARPRKKRRNSHGSAWHWKQTDCWYYTLPGTKRRMSLFDVNGERIRGNDNRDAAEEALARLRVAGDYSGPDAVADSPWIVARVASDYLQYCERSVMAGSMSRGHYDTSKSFLNDFCGYCGALTVAELKKSHVQTWLESHSGWKSPASHRSAIAVILAAFNRAEEHHGVSSPLKGLKKPQSQPRLQSFSREEEQTLYDATEECFRNFLFAALHTGLRPFCELAKITAEHVEVGERGMMWRVYSSKTKKTRKIPVQRPVAELVKKLLATAPRGSGKPLFRNTKGEPWKRMTGVVRFLALKKKLGWDLDPVRGKYSCYTCRHTFAHRMLSGYWNGGLGCSIETLAELMGDTPAVAYQHYGKEWALSYQEPLWAAIGAGKLTAANVEETSRGMMWRLRSSKTKKLRKIPVRPEVAQLVRRLLKTAGSDEPIFRNRQGNPWKKVTGDHYFLRLKRQLGWTGDDSRAKYSCYSCRHTFAHRMLSGHWNEGVGCSIEVLAELMGDTQRRPMITTAANGDAIIKNRFGRRSAKPASRNRLLKSHEERGI